MALVWPPAPPLIRLQACLPGESSFHGSANRAIMVHRRSTPELQPGARYQPIRTNRAHSRPASTGRDPVLPSSRVPLRGTMRPARRGQRHLTNRSNTIQPQKQIADRPTLPVCQPALRPMVRPVMLQVAPLANAPQVGQPVVGRVVIHMGRGQDDASGADLDGFHQVGPPNRSAALVAPCRCGAVEPASVRQAANAGKMRTAATLATAACPFEPHPAAQRRPVRRVLRSQSRLDWHDECVSFVGIAIAV